MVRAVCTAVRAETARVPNFYVPAALPPARSIAITGRRAGTRVRRCGVSCVLQVAVAEEEAAKECR